MNKKTDNMLGMLWHDTEYQDIIKDSKYNRLYCTSYDKITTKKTLVIYL